MRPKILHVTQTTGGVETSLLLLFRHLDHRRFELHLACPPGTGLAQEARALGIEVFEIPMVRSVHVIRDPVALLRLVALIRRSRYSIVHGHSAKGGYLARVGARMVGGPKTIYHPRAFSYLSQRGLARSLFLGLERLAVPLTDVLIATSASEADRAIREVGFAEPHVVVMPNSIDFGEGAAWESGNAECPPLVLTIGRFSHQKNPEMFVRVAALVAARSAEARFAMLGAGFAGPLEAGVRRMVAKAGLESRFEILPWTSKQQALKTMSACSVFVLTSRFEGMPNTLLEALMLRKPVVATNVDGSSDVIGPGVAGYAVAPDDDRAMAEYIVTLLEDRKLARRLGEAGHARARTHFDIRANVTILEQLYLALAADRV